MDFVVRRLEQLLVDGGVPAEAARAVLAERADNPALAAASARALTAELAAGESGLLRRVMMAFSRPTRIVRGKEVRGRWVAGCIGIRNLRQYWTVAKAYLCLAASSSLCVWRRGAAVLHCT